MKKKLTALLIIAVMLFSIGSFTASAYDDDLLDSITENYDKALSLAGRRSFYGHCNLATAYQLLALGIYEGKPDYSGTGSSWHKHFKDVSSTSGGYNIVTISGSNCLYDLVSRYGDEIYNVAYSLGTGGTSGSEHVLFIRAIIDGYVYFADSFSISYHRTYYSQGEGTVLPLDEFVSEYKRMNGNAYGCVYFTKGKTEHLAGSTENPEDWKNSDIVYTEGKYIVTASMLRVREKANTKADTLDMIPNGETVIVTEIDKNWGKVEYNGKTGWVCLTYTLRLSEVVDPLSVVSLTASRPAVFSGTEVVWTAKAQGGASSKYFYSFYIYKDGKKVYNGTYTTANTVSYTPDSVGSYTASVTVTDSENNTAELLSTQVVCVGDKTDLVMGDVNGDGFVSASDARLALRIAAAVEFISGKDFICADIDGDGKISSADARKILRKASNADDGEEI